MQAPELCKRKQYVKKMFDDSHHGFTEGKSGLANLVVFYNRITALIDERRPTDIFLPGHVQIIWHSPTQHL